MIVPNRWIRAVLLLISVVALAVSASQAQTAREIAKKASPSVVMLVMEDQNGQPLSLGSGFVVREGIIATNRHVVEGASRGYAKLAGQKEKHNIDGTVGVNTFADLVLLSCKSLKRDTGSLGEKPQSRQVSVPPLTLGDSNQVEVGDEVYVVGNPMGLEGTISRGIVSGIRKMEKDKLFQITAPISPGSSGGPVLNAKGEVIGVAVATFKGGQNLNFAVPASYLSSLLQNIEAVKPLAVKKKLSNGQAKSILGKSGGGIIEGVEVRNFRWASGSSRDFYLTLRNLSRKPIKNVRCMLICYDQTGVPVDFTYASHWNSIIPPGLAKTVWGGFDTSMGEVARRNAAGELETPEIRVLSFEFAEPEETKDLP
ncbi:MAG: serine protease [Phycisphaerae bacterium]|nr:serine protease [Phycisphaerae bacterium]